MKMSEQEHVLGLPNTIKEPRCGQNVTLRTLKKMVMQDQATRAWQVAVIILSALVLAVLADSLENHEGGAAVSCPIQNKHANLSMAGLGAGNRLVRAWQEEYSSSNRCPGFTISSFEENSWDYAAARICGSSLTDAPVDLAGMSGSIFLSQATTVDGWRFQCKRSKLNREATVVLAARRGIVVGSSKDGAAAHCLSLLGGGLSKSQLRWIFSSSSTADLIGHDWDATSVPYMDNDDKTHLWSELHENCTKTEILLAVEEVGDSQENVLDFLHEYLVRRKGETLRDFFSNATSPDEITEFLQTNGGAISIFHLQDTLALPYQQRNLLSIGIRDKRDKVIFPFGTSLEAELYPLSKPVTLGLVNHPDALELTRPFLEFAFSSEGTEIMQHMGYQPVEAWKILTMYSRIGSKLGLPVDEIKEYCGPLDGVLQIAGATVSIPIFQIWSEAYKVGCPTLFTLEGGGSSAGARRVCESTDNADSVGIGMMSRHFKTEQEAVPRSNPPFVYDCLIDQSQSVVNVEIALDGMTVMFAVGSLAEQCVRLLGGLTMDQLRWIYSSYSDDKLEATGWDPNCLANSDFDPTTHLWSELDHRCAKEEIHLVGDYRGEGTFTSFSELVFHDWANGETVASDRPTAYLEGVGNEVLYHLIDNEYAISFGGYHYYISYMDVFWAAPVARQASGPFVVPSEATIADKSYALYRYLYVNVRDQSDILEKATAILDFGFAHPQLIRSIGYVPLDESVAAEMLQRLQNGPYPSTTSKNDNLNTAQNQSQVGLIVGLVIGGIVAVVVIFIAMKYYLG